MRNEFGILVPRNFRLAFGNARSRKRCAAQVPAFVQAVVADAFEHVVRHKVFADIFIVEAVRARFLGLGADLLLGFLRVAIVLPQVGDVCTHFETLFVGEVSELCGCVQATTVCQYNSRL